MITCDFWGSKNTNSQKEEEFEPPKTIYKFLDSFYPENFLMSKKYLNLVLENESIEMVFATLAKHMRDLFWIKSDPKTMSYPTWRMEKLKMQAKKYSLQELKEMIKNLSKIDIKVKTSDKTILTLLDLLIIRKLK